MKVLIIGSGGREHALAWKLAQSDRVEKLYLAPGNGGVLFEDKCENLSLASDPASPEGQAALRDFALREGAALTVVGPEAPLAEGIVDRFREAGLPVVGPDRAAARLEASKVWSKSFMAKYGVRTAAGASFTDPSAALAHAERHFGAGGGSLSAAAENPLVIKADGLAAGKGVAIAASRKEAEETIRSFMTDKTLGNAGAAVVLEEFIPGREVSILAAVSVTKGKRGVILPFIPARDHKRRFDGGRGPNTGGMGAIAPVPDFSGAARSDFTASVLEPTLRGMEAEGMDYRGFIFFGLMVRGDRCHLLEYNVRLGDPETQAVLPLADFDFVDLCAAVLDGGLAGFPLAWKDGAVCAPVAVAEGYPGTYRRGDPITVDRAALAETGARLFAAGALRGGTGGGGGGLVTAGGRVLAVSAWGADAGEAREKAYRAMGAVGFQGMDYRRDIGQDTEEL
ncbi:MAG: phosphoribosylamine--glycine ligase [Treponema sp.]|nr:phosphoribosylamine--glycine ligase [Treponema sp.]